MYWDGEETPSVESPLGDFFCCGFGRGCVVNSMPIVVNPARGFNSYFPMPFGKKAKITVENQHKNSVPAFFSIRLTTVFMRRFLKTQDIFTPSGDGSGLRKNKRIMWCWTVYRAVGSTLAPT